MKNNINKIYTITSVIFLIVLAISPLKSYFSEWRKVQKKYNEITERLLQKVKPAPMALQQIWARDLDQIDRCTTCHLGVENKNLTDVPQPFQSHPQIPHDINKFGCTICHEGQGLATTYEDAHLPSEFWDKPVLPTQYIESSCGRCHQGTNLKETPMLNRGRKLIQQLNCTACHEIPGMQRSFVPSLNGIGSKVVARSWLVRWLKNSLEIQPNTKMPTFALSEEEVELLTDFLMSFKTFTNNVKLEPLPEIYWQNKDEDEFTDLGKTRFREARCISCHAVEGRGGHLATDLAKIASKAKEEWIYNYIKNPKRFQPDVEMPQYGFSDKEIAAVTAYIESEFIDWEAPEEEENQPHEPLPNYYERGLAIYNKYNCAGCHQLSNAKVAQNLGPDLTAIGSKKNYEIDFGNAQIPHTLYDYIDAKLRIPHEFGPSVRMPRYNLTDEDRQAITTFLLSLKDEDLPRQFVQKVNPPSLYEHQGKIGEIVQKYSCFKCHSFNGVGGDIAPDLAFVGSQLQRDWTRQYFKIPYSLRPIVEERMPNLFISDEEVDILLDYFYTVLLNDRISTPNWVPTQEAEERGQGLFWEKYGCQGCHMLGGTGGYVGPPLDNVGDRLRPGWILAWIINPQKYKPDTIEPRSGMSVDEARDLAAYLTSLKTSGKQ